MGAILVQSSWLIVVALGMNFVLLAAGVDLSVGATMYLAAVVVGLGLPDAPVWVCLLASVVGRRMLRRDQCLADRSTRVARIHRDAGDDLRRPRLGIVSFLDTHRVRRPQRCADFGRAESVWDFLRCSGSRQSQRLLHGCC